MQNFYFFWIRLTVVVLLRDTFAIAASPPADEHFIYRCGDVEFSSEAVMEVISTEVEKFTEFNNYPISYEGPLYNAQDQYVMSPIMNGEHVFDQSKETQYYNYFVIFTWSGVLIDVIERRSYNEDIRCLRINTEASPRPASTSSSSLSNIHETARTPFNHDWHNGYDCGSKFFSYETISNSLNLAELLKTRQNQDKSIPYYSSTCPNSPCLLWPIPYAKDKADSGSDNNLSFLIMTDHEFILKGVVAWSDVGVVGMCNPAVNPRDKQQSVNMMREIQVTPGYQCGLDNFPIDYLNSEVEKLKWARSNGMKYPKHHVGPEFNDEVLIWPVLPGRKSSSKGPARSWFLVMDKALEIVCVAVRFSSKYKCCPIKEVVRTGLGETGDFKCLKKIIVSKNQIARARKQACGSEDRPYTKFPAYYFGPGFDVPGPYVTWPLVKSHFTSYVGRFRVVINSDCQLAGVLITTKTRDLVKCQRLKDGTTPGGGSSNPSYEIPKTVKSRDYSLSSRKKNKLHHFT